MNDLPYETRRAIITVTDTARGGAPSRLATLARGLRDKGWKILFVSVLPEGAIAKELRSDGFEVASLNLKSWADLPLALLRLRRSIRRFQPMVIQTALWHANLLGRLCAIGTGVPVVNGHESIDADRPSGRTVLERLTAPLAAAHTAVAEAVAEQIHTRDRIPRERITVIPVTKDWNAWVPKGRRHEIRKGLGIPTDSRVIAWSGRLHPVKNVDLLLQALGHLPGWWALIVGDGPERGRLDRMTDRLGLSDRVLFTGELRDVSPYLEAADVFCLVSRWEGLPTALMEAMAMGLPVVAPRIGGIRELIHPGITGHLVETWEPQDIAAAIQTAARQPDLGINAAQMIRHRYKHSDVIEAHERLWRSLNDDS